MLKFDLRGIEVALHGVRQDSPPKMIRIDYEIVVDTGETGHRLDLLHKSQQEYGTIYNTLAGATDLVGTIRLKNWNSSQTGRCGERKYHVKDYSTSLSR